MFRDYNPDSCLRPNHAPAEGKKSSWDMKIFGMVWLRQVRIPHPWEVSDTPTDNRVKGAGRLPERQLGKDKGRDRIPGKGRGERRVHGGDNSAVFARGYPLGRDLPLKLRGLAHWRKGLDTGVEGRG